MNFVLPAALAAVVLAGLYVGQAVVNPEVGRRRQTATIRNSLAMLALILSAELAVVVTTALRARSVGETSVLLHRPSSLALALSGLVLDLATIFVLWLRMVRPGYLSWPDLGFDLARFWAQAGEWIRLGIWAALMGKLAMILIAVAIVNTLGILPNQSDLFAGAVVGPGWEFAVLMGVACVLAPITEELFFRGYVFKTLLGQRGSLVAYLFSAFLFAAVHLNPTVFPELFVLGLINGWLVQRTGSVIPGIVGHSLNNLTSFALLRWVLENRTIAI